MTVNRNKKFVGAGLSLVAFVAVVMIVVVVNRTETQATLVPESAMVPVIENVVTPAQINQIDHSKVIGNHEAGGNCIGCHKEEGQAWSKTHHYRSLEKLDEGRPIAEKLGLGRKYKKTGFCIECHSTAKGDAAPYELISGVSCESCHGPAKDWKTVHNDLNIAQPERFKKSDDAGMIRKDRVYLIAKNCFGCHLVPNETLVNTGGHKAASDFELVSWLHGEVLHNYAGDTTKNRGTTQERKRVLYIVGKLVHLEMSLYAAGKITERGHYRSAILNSVRKAWSGLQEIMEKVDVPELKPLAELQTRDDGSLALSGALLKSLPGTVAKIAENFADKHDGSKLGSVDPLIPGPEKYKHTRHP